ncbi:MAG: M24 family metallopeptidase [Spirochaetaceae bacterium]|jgi:Xaa-Pro dipeptidase|nr:M24 family metallopeptidase [Spirochaetaceae bacterium]
MSFVERREKIYDWMAKEGISLLILEDAEHNRDKSVRYLTGQPGDALVFLSATRKCLLVPWDVNMAALHANADDVLPYAKFDLNANHAAKAAAAYFKTPYGGRIETPARTSYPAFLKYVENLSDYDVLCRNEGARAELERLRAVKDADEIRLYRLLAEKTNEIIDLVEKNVVDKTLKTETDVALFIEAECRARSCEGTGFQTLAAGPTRSFGIHCFPSYTAGAFADKGLSILDFGIVLQGYSSDVTMSFARAPSKAQERQLQLVEKAFAVAYNIVAETFKGKKPEAKIPARDVALAVDDFFKKEKCAMPHGLGHGVGLDVHEAPYLRRNADAHGHIERGMIFTIEPGLYDPAQGGCRYENDILIGEEGAEILTKSKIVRL